MVATENVDPIAMAAATAAADVIAPDVSTFATNAANYAFYYKQIVGCHDDECSSVRRE